MAQKFSVSFYHSAAWKRARLEALKRDGFCCAKCGKPAEEVHHKIPLTPANITDQSVSLDLENLVSLCFDCHQNEHGNRAETAVEFAPDGRPMRT